MSLQILQFKKTRYNSIISALFSPIIRQKKNYNIISTSSGQKKLFIDLINKILQLKITFERKQIIN